MIRRLTQGVPRWFIVAAFVIVFVSTVSRGSPVYAATVAAVVWTVVFVLLWRGVAWLVARRRLRLQ
jgi:hypothetical protein